MARNGKDIENESLVVTSSFEANDIVQIAQHSHAINACVFNDRQSNVKYSQLSDITSELVRCVINDSEKSTNALHFLTQWVSKLRLKEDCYPIFSYVGTLTDKEPHHSSNKTDKVQDPISAVSKYKSSNNCRKRLKSMIERNREQAKKKTKSLY